MRFVLLFVGDSVMYLQASDNVNMRGNKFSKFIKQVKQKALDTLPNSTCKNPKDVEKYQKYTTILSHPAKNRLIMGATAIITQPTIDFLNHDVNKETREVSRNRTIAKILIGTAVGVLVRGSCYRIVNYFTNTKSKNKIHHALLSEKFIKSLVQNENQLKIYQNCLSTFLAMIAMTFTNYYIDAPLTQLFANYLNKKVKTEASEGRVV